MILLVWETSGSDWDQFEARVPLGVLVNFLKAQSVREADSARFGWWEKPQIANEENSVLVDCRFSRAAAPPPMDNVRPR